MCILKVIYSTFFFFTSLKQRYCYYGPVSWTQIEILHSILVQDYISSTSGESGPKKIGDKKKQKKQLKQPLNCLPVIAPETVIAGPQIDGERDASAVAVP